MLTLHCAAILLHVAGLEANGLLQPVSELASDYLSLTGCRQHWAVFSSIPFYHDYRVELEVLDTSGRRRSVGPILPSLTAYDRGSIRYLKVFEYLAGSEQKLLLSEYLQNARARLAATTGEEIRRLTLKRRVRMIVGLEQVRETGLPYYESEIGTRQWVD